VTQLALFDLDHTLLPCDSDYEWGQFLARIGVVDSEYQPQKQTLPPTNYFAAMLLPCPQDLTLRPPTPLQEYCASGFQHIVHSMQTPLQIANLRLQSF
jgi:phosphoserine phosphatase